MKKLLARSFAARDADRVDGARAAAVSDIEVPVVIIGDTDQSARCRPTKPSISRTSCRAPRRASTDRAGGARDRHGRHRRRDQGSPVPDPRGPRRYGAGLVSQLGLLLELPDAARARSGPSRAVPARRPVDVRSVQANVPSINRVLPIELVKRVEMITGPGGVLWGSNSLMGILNVITKDAEDVDGVEVGGGLGDGQGDRNMARAYVMAGTSTASSRCSATPASRPIRAPASTCRSCSSTMRCRSRTRRTRTARSSQTDQAQSLDRRSQREDHVRQAPAPRLVPVRQDVQAARSVGKSVGAIQRTRTIR